MGRRPRQRWARKGEADQCKNEELNKKERLQLAPYSRRAGVMIAR
jgi:hypothetical protein